MSRRDRMSPVPRPEKPLRDMTEPELAALMKRAARLLEDAVLPPGTGFALLAFDEPGLAQYVANRDRRDMIKAMRECATRVEARDTLERVPFKKGS